MSAFTESTVEDAAFACLEGVGWPVQRLLSSQRNAARHSGGPGVAPEAERFLGRAL